MNAVLGAMLGGLTILGLGTIYVTSQDKAKDSAALAQQQLMQQQLMQQQLLAQQYAYQAQAPIGAPPTYQGQTAGGAVASVVDGLVSIISML